MNLDLASTPGSLCRQALQDAAPLPFASPIIGDKMVLLRGKPNAIWGWIAAGRPGEHRGWRRVDPCRPIHFGHADGGLVMKSEKPAEFSVAGDPAQRRGTSRLQLSHRQLASHHRKPNALKEVIDDDNH